MHRVFHKHNLNFTNRFKSDFSLLQAFFYYIKKSYSLLQLSNFLKYFPNSAVIIYKINVYIKLIKKTKN